MSFLDQRIELHRIDLNKNKEILFQKTLPTGILNVYTDNYKSIVVCDDESVYCFNHHGDTYFHKWHLFNRNHFHQCYISNRYMVFDGDEDGLVIYDITGPKDYNAQSNKYSYLKHLMETPVFNSSQLRK